MAYFIKKSKSSKKGEYLQIYKSSYTPGIGTRNTSYRSLGYTCDLIASGISDPIAHFQKEVDELNDKNKSLNEAQIGEESVNKYLGHFLPKAMFDLLDMDKILNIVAANFKCQYKFSDMFKTLCYSQILSPGLNIKLLKKLYLIFMELIITHMIRFLTLLNSLVVIIINISKFLICI